MAATAAIALPAGGGVVGGGVVGGGVVTGGVVAGAVVPTTPPVQATPFSVNAVGAVLAPAQEPLKPNETLPLVAMAPL